MKTHLEATKAALKCTEGLPLVRKNKISVTSINFKHVILKLKVNLNK